MRLAVDNVMEPAQRWKTTVAPHFPLEKSKEQKSVVGRDKREQGSSRPNGLPCACCLAPARDAIGALLSKTASSKVGKRGRRWRLGARAHGDGDFSACWSSVALPKRNRRDVSVVSYFDQQLAVERRVIQL